MKKWLMFMLIGLLPATGHALGLGPITMKSALNQPLDATIEIHSVQKGDLDGLSVKIASEEDFQRVSVEKSSFLNRIEFKVVKSSDSSGYIQISTKAPVTEPYLDFLIDARWPRGRELKEYTVLVDPPVLTAEAPAPIKQADARPEPAPAASASSSRTTSAPRSSTSRFSPPKLPTPAAPRPAPKIVAPPPPPRPAPAPEADTEETETAQAGNLIHGKVRRNETLSEIAQKMRPSDVTLQQMMLALLRSNPEAFIGGNINRLKAGADLRIDNPELLKELSRAEARAEVARQNTEWRANRVVEQTELASNRVEDGKSSSKSSGSSASAGARLKLLAPGSKGAGTGGGMEEGQDVGQLKQNLQLATEALDANKQENSELKGRLSELEQQVESMQRLINLKDQEMAALQTQVKKKGEEPEVVANDELAKEQEKPVTKEVKQAPQKQPEEASGGLLSDTTIIALAVFLVVALVAWMVIRRKRMQDGFEESILNVGGLDDAMASNFSASGLGHGGFSSHGSVGSMASGFVMSDMSGIQTDTSEVDPISEAEVYLAYGRHQQAEDILKQALENDDNRLDYHEKLLEVYNAANNAPAFEAHARTMYDKLGGNTNDQHWQRVAAMGAALCPNSVLFGGSGKASAATKSFAAAAAVGAGAANLGAVSNDEEDLLDFDFDVDGFDLDGGGSGGKSAAAADDDDGLDFDIGSLDFNLDDGGDTRVSSPAAKSAPLKASPALDKFSLDMGNDSGMDAFNDDNSLDFDMGGSSNMDSGLDALNFDDLDLEQTNDANGPIDLVDSGNDLNFSFDDDEAAAEPMELSLDGDALTLEEVEDYEGSDLSGEFDEDIFANVDEIGSKLDLAKAYVDMGDSDGARSILDEVMEEGDATQKQQAQQLLQQMG